MPRLAHIAVADMPYHVTQRGNGRQFLLEEHAGRLVYLGLLQKYVQLYRLPFRRSDPALCPPIPSSMQMCQ